MKTFCYIVNNDPRFHIVFILLQASFFISYVVTSGWTSVSSELFRMIPLIFSIIKRLFSGKDSDEFEVPSISYHSEIPRILFFGVLGITYFLLAPLILPFLLVYCCMGYLIYRNQVHGNLSIISFILRKKSCLLKL